MPSSPAELYLPRSRAHESRATGRRARAAAEQLSREGVPIRYVRTTYLPDDETCFHHFRSAHARSRRRGQPPRGARPCPHCSNDRGVPTRASARKVTKPAGSTTSADERTRTALPSRAAVGGRTVGGIEVCRRRVKTDPRRRVSSSTRRNTTT